MSNALPKHKFFSAVGELIRHARENAGLTQEELASGINKQRPTISQYENGKMLPDLLTLLQLSQVLKKPAMYFIPVNTEFEFGLNNREAELIIHFRRIGSADMQEIAISQVKAIADLENRREGGSQVTEAS